MYKIGLIGVMRDVFESIFHKGISKQGVMLKPTYTAGIHSYIYLVMIVFAQLLQTDKILQIGHFFLDLDHRGIAVIQLITEQVGELQQVFAAPSAFCLSIRK